MFKHPRLSTVNHLVNASSALALLFLAASCGNSDENTSTPTPAPDVETPEKTDETTLTLPAVWSSRNLNGQISNIGLAGGLGSRVAVVFESGDLQLLDFDGDRVTDKAALEVRDIANGRYQLLSGTPVTVFPGISQMGDLTAYIHGGELPAPLAYPLDSGQDTALGGLCSSAPTREEDGVMLLAFWTENNPQLLYSGRLVEVNEELVFLPDDPVRADAPITACVLGPDGALVFSAPIIAAEAMTRAGATTVFTLDSSGGLTATNENLPTSGFTVTDGITVRVPEIPADIAAETDARTGGYANGIFMLAGENNAGDDVVVFVDPGNITRSVLEPE